MPADESTTFPSLSLKTGFPVVRPAPTQHQKVQRQAKKLVADAFYGTLMRQMHNSPFKSELFSGGRGGEAFQSMLDQRLSDHMAAATNNPLVHAIAHRLEKPRTLNGQLLRETYRSVKTAPAQSNVLNTRS